MNLTSKRILNGLAVCAGAFALTASAVTTWVSDSFEAADGGADGQAIKFFKAAQWGVGVDQTNYLWVADADDASKLVDTNRTYTGTRPIPGATEELILQLDTEGKTLTRYVDIHTNETETALVTNSVPFSESSAVYVDTLIKFVVSEDPPSITDPDVKVAVFVNAESNLVVYHRVYTNTINTITTNSVIAGNLIDPEKWYRLTIQMGVNFGDASCQVWLDGGDPLTHENAYTDAGAPNGSWFVLATPSTEKTLTQISFQGTGAIDEFVVASEVDLSGSTAVMLTLAFDDTLVRVLNMGAAGAPVANNGTVEAGTLIAIEATTNWFEIASVTGAATGSFSGTPTPGALVTATTGTVSATEADTLTVTAQKFSGGTISTGLGGGSLPADKVADWAMGLNTPLNPDQLTGDMLDDYLLDVEPGTDATISITSIAVDGTTVTIKVAATDGVNLGAINGTLKVVSSDTLPISGEPTDIEFTTEAGVATIVIPNSGKFIKATVE